MSDIEKTPVESLDGTYHEDSQHRGLRRRLVVRLLSCCIFTALAYFTVLVNGLHLSSAVEVPICELGKQPDWEHAIPELVWERLLPQPADNLTWVSCYRGSFKCARLQVPLDYSNLSAGYGGIALINYPARVPANSLAYRGPILFNPGGPGGSGVTLISLVGPSYQLLIGEEYDIVSFDPRGVMRSTPQVRVFPTNEERATLAIKISQDPLVNTTMDALPRMHARAEVLGRLAEERTGNTTQYISTALVARDMLSIIHAFGQDKLQYWGFSYGTVLGATFASMFPNHVERILLDVVVDPYDYITTQWRTNLRDTDKSFDWFLHSCVDAGPARCALFEPSVEKIRARIHRLLNQLKRSPVPFSGLTQYGQLANGIVDYKLVKTILMLHLYGPYAGVLSAPLVASALYELELGNAQPLAYFIRTFQGAFECPTCPQKPGEPKLPNYDTPEAQLAIICNDGDEVLDSVTDLGGWFSANAELSEFADVFSVRAWCVGWKVRPVERFTGPFVGNTSYPILLIGNAADPVTPLSNALNTSKGFNGSVVLTQNSAGHCSITASSLCTALTIRAYFRDGNLPPKGTICEPESRMFPPPPGDPKWQKERYAGEAMSVMQAWGTIRSSFPVYPYGTILLQPSRLSP